ncbi:MAG: hypothetical protein JWR26_4050 [Pedosphaera sp.]|nr:hypothetical protein [Pedosphaera sp.]
MKQTIRNTILAAILVIAAISPQIARAAEDLRAEAQQTINQFKAKDPTLASWFDSSAGYAVFPNVAKGGLVVGGARGKGLVYERGKVIGQVTMTQASIGAQVGGQSYSEVIFFETPAALQEFKDSKLEMSADINAVAAAQGVAKTAKYQQGVAVFTLPKSGLMAQASVGGQKFKFEPLP